MTTTMTYSETLVVTNCWCGMTYAIPKKLYDHMIHKRDNNERQPDVYCPMGHTWVIGGTSALDKERDRRIAAEASLSATNDQLKAERRSHTTTKANLTKARKRADRGVCQHCNRSFVNVTRHVATKHPESLDG